MKGSIHEKVRSALHDIVPGGMDRLVKEYVAKWHEEEQPLTLTGMIISLGVKAADGEPGIPGVIFALKNMGWSDRHEVEFRGVANVDLTKPRDELVARIAAGASVLSVLAGTVSDGLDPQIPQ